MVALSPASANRQVQRDLLSLLRPSGSLSSGMLIRLRGVGLVTHAVGTQFDGLCRRDAVSVLYAPSDSNEPPRDRPLRPYGVEAHPEFHATHLPLRGRPGNDGRVDLGGCGALDRDDKINWFTAPDPKQAALAANALRIALELVRQGSTPLLSCSNIKDCRGFVQKFGDMDRIDSIESCPAGQSEFCFVIDVSGTLELQLSGKVPRDEVQPTSISSIEASQYLIVT